MVDCSRCGRRCVTGCPLDGCESSCTGSATLYVWSVATWKGKRDIFFEVPGASCRRLTVKSGSR